MSDHQHLVFRQLTVHYHERAWTSHLILSINAAAMHRRSVATTARRASAATCTASDRGQNCQSGGCSSK